MTAVADYPEVKMLRTIIETLTGEDDFTISRRVVGGTVMLEIFIRDKSACGRVVGKGGVCIEAMRVLMRHMPDTQNQLYYIKVTQSHR